jgi:hypothetical protein
VIAQEAVETGRISQMTRFDRDVDAQVAKVGELRKVME